MKATALPLRAAGWLHMRRHRTRDRMQQVTVRLAAQTVGLVLVMLIALEVVVYVITQGALLNSLQDALKSRGVVPAQFVAGVYRLPIPPSRPGGGFNGGAPTGGDHGGVPGGAPGGYGGPGDRNDFNPDQIPSDVSSLFVDTHMIAVHHIGTLGNTVLDRPAITTALRTGQTQCCTVRRYDGQDYLVYTEPLRVNGKKIGALQNAVSQSQYESTMHLLLQSLAVVALLGLLTSGAVSAVVVNRSLQPIQMAVQRQRDFVADAAHELRTPLAIMRTVGELGMSASTVDDLQETVAQMLGENHHLTRLVEDLSLLARSDTDTVPLTHAPVDLSAVVRDTTTELRVLTAENHIELNATVQDGVVVVGDVLRLRQLLLILLDNARKHTPPGSAINVELSLSGGRARLQVIDSGQGIPTADLPRIFDRFYRADEARVGEGSGLGLAIGKWIVEAHGGTLRAANVMPHGAAFTVTLPPGRRIATA